MIAFLIAFPFIFFGAWWALDNAQFLKNMYFHLKNYALFKIRSFILNYYGIGIAVDKPQNGTIEVDYFYRDTLYTVIFKKNRIRKIEHIFKAGDDIDNDITNELRRYMGPYGDFHGISVSPKQLSLTYDIIVAYKNKEHINYKNTDFIVI